MTLIMSILLLAFATYTFVIAVIFYRLGFERGTGSGFFRASMYISELTDDNLYSTQIRGRVTHTR